MNATGEELLVVMPEKVDPHRVCEEKLQETIPYAESP